MTFVSVVVFCNSLRAEIQKRLRADKRFWLEQQCGLIDEFDKKHKSKELFRQIKSVKSNKKMTSQLPIKSTSDETLTEKEDIMSRWKEYGQSLFCLPDGETQPPPPPEPPPYPETPPEPPPLLSEIEAAIKQLSYGKSLLSCFSISFRPLKETLHDKYE